MDYVELNINSLLYVWSLIDELADEQTKERFELDDILYDISMKIFDYRISKGWTQKLLAEKLGIKQSMVSKLESGEYNPTVEQLCKISKKLGWNFELILKDKEEVETNVWENVNEEYNELESKGAKAQVSIEFDYNIQKLEESRKKRFLIPNIVQFVGYDLDNIKGSCMS